MQIEGRKGYTKRQSTFEAESAFFRQSTLASKEVVHFRENAVRAGVLNTDRIDTSSQTVDAYQAIIEDPANVTSSVLRLPPELINALGIEGKLLERLADNLDARNAILAQIEVALTRLEADADRSLADLSALRRQLERLICNYPVGDFLETRDQQDCYAAHVARSIYNEYDCHRIRYTGHTELGNLAVRAETTRHACRIAVNDPSVSIRVEPGNEAAMSFYVAGRRLSLTPEKIDLDGTLAFNRGRRPEDMRTVWGEVAGGVVAALPVPTFVTLYVANGQQVDLTDAHLPGVTVHTHGGGTFHVGTDTAISLRVDEAGPSTPAVLSLPVSLLMADDNYLLTDNRILTVRTCCGCQIRVGDLRYANLRLSGDDGDRQEEVVCTDGRALFIERHEQLAAAIRTAAIRLQA
jgi:hypothetical protein